MASSKPVLHGRDHLPGGPDPIPILAATLGVQYTYLASNGPITIPDNATEVGFDLQGGISTAGAPALTDNPEVFSTGAISGGPFDGLHGIKISEVGVYGAFINVVTTSPDESAISTPVAQAVSTEQQGTGSFSQSSFNFGGEFTQAVFGHQDIFVLWAIGADTLGAFTSQTILITAQNNRGGGSGDVDVKCYLTVVRLSHTDITEDGTLALF